MMKILETQLGKNINEVKPVRKNFKSFQNSTQSIYPSVKSAPTGNQQFAKCHSFALKANTPEFNDIITET